MSGKDEYPEREVTVTVEVTTAYTAAYQLDERDYLDWLKGRPDDDGAMCDYLRAGDDFETIGAIYDDATRKGSTEVIESEIIRVEAHP